MTSTIKLSQQKIFLFSLIAIVIFFLFLEIIFFIVDQKIVFQPKIQTVLDTMITKNKVVLGPNYDQQTKKELIARNEVDYPPKNEIYKIGGRQIPKANLSANIIYLDQTKLLQDKRKKVFLVGGSAAFGYPYRYRYKDTYTAILNQDEELSNYKFINIAQVGWQSGRLVPLVYNAIDHYGANIIVLYTGNNEWVNWVLPTQKQLSQKWLKLFRFLSNSYFFSFFGYLRMQNLIRQQEQKRDEVSANSDFIVNEKLFGFQSALDNPAEKLGPFQADQWRRDKQEYLQAFEHNLQLMIDHAKRKKVQILLVTVPFNYKLAIDWKHPQPHSMNKRKRDLTQNLIQQIQQSLLQQDCNSVLALVEKAIHNEPEVPLFSYLKAYCLEQQKLFAQAESSYALAREKMVGNFGGRISINEKIRAVATQNQIPLIDLKQIYDEHEHKNGFYFNQSLIHDDCHPTPRGHQILSQSIKNLLKK